jgi:hypothetical protein
MTRAGDPITIVRRRPFRHGVTLNHVYAGHWHERDRSGRPAFFWNTREPPDPRIDPLGSLACDDEGTTWIQGHHTAASSEGRALLAAYLLTRSP